MVSLNGRAMTRVHVSGLVRGLLIREQIPEPPLLGAIRCEGLGQFLRRLAAPIMKSPAGMSVSFMPMLLVIGLAGSAPRLVGEGDTNGKSPYEANTTPCAKRGHIMIDTLSLLAG